MGGSKNRGGPPKWMVKIMENPIKMDDLGVPLFSETSKWGRNRTFFVKPQNFQILERKNPQVFCNEGFFLVEKKRNRFEVWFWVEVQPVEVGSLCNFFLEPSSILHQFSNMYPRHPR